MIQRISFIRVSSILMALALMLTLFLASGSGVQAEVEVFINEIHYDNSGTDEGEAIEIAGPAGTDLTGWSLMLYNGNGGVSYDTEALSGFLPDQDNGYGTLYWEWPTNGIQNGSPDGLALVSPHDVVEQFLCYEGTFTATDGPAAGLSCDDIGVQESSGTAVVDSLQLTGTGSHYEDFSWTGPTTSVCRSRSSQRFSWSTPSRRYISACCWSGPRSPSRASLPSSRA